MQPWTRLGFDFASRAAGVLPNIPDIQKGFSKRWCLVLQLELLEGA